MKNLPVPKRGMITRRRLMGAAALSAGATGLAWESFRRARTEPVVILKNTGYKEGVEDALRRGLIELGVTSSSIKGKKVVLKPNLVEPRRRARQHAPAHHPGGHPGFPFPWGCVGHGCRGGRARTRPVFRPRGVGATLPPRGKSHSIPRPELRPGRRNAEPRPLDEDDSPDVAANRSRSRPARIARQNEDAPLGRNHLVDENLFGLMPGAYYGWPKNVLHEQGLLESILDINATVRPHLAIIDGILGMGGDGPIMGDPIPSNVLVMGTNPTAVDATCARVMGIAPESVEYLDRASAFLGPIAERWIEQRGESIGSVRVNYPLLDHIPAHRSLKKI